MENIIQSHTFTCTNCGMSFKIKPQRKRGETTRCATPNCGLRFTHTTVDSYHVNISVTQEDLDQHLRTKYNRI